MAGTATLTSKGQITIPKQVRDILGVHEGDLLVFESKPRGIIELKTARSSTRLKGFIRPWISHATKPPSLQDMNQAVLRGMRKLKG